MKKYRFPIQSQIEFFQKMSGLLRTNISLATALQIICNQSKSSHKATMDIILADILEGKSFASSLQMHTNIKSFIISLVSTGERFGLLQENMKRISEQLKKQQALKRTLISALIYPGFIAGATFLLSSFMLIYIFPKILPVLKTVSATLPSSTRVVIALSAFLQAYGLLAFLLMSVCIILFFILKNKLYSVQKHTDYLLLSLPAVGALYKKYEIITTLRSLGYIYKSGASIHEAINAARDSSQTIMFKELYSRMYQNTLEGKTISSVLSKHEQYVPESTVQLIAIAETTGSLAETCIALSELYEEELDLSLKRISLLLEPILMIIMGCIVGFIALSMITPIYSISQKLQR
jgi:type IV pilus assembly protein PilC